MIKHIVTAVAFLLLATASLSQDLVAKMGKDEIILHTNKQCTNQKILEMFKPSGRPPELIKAGTAIVDGKEYQLCYIERQYDYFLGYDDGDQGSLNKYVPQPR